MQNRIFYFLIKGEIVTWVCSWQVSYLTIAQKSDHIPTKSIVTQGLDCLSHILIT